MGKNEKNSMPPRVVLRPADETVVGQKYLTAGFAPFISLTGSSSKPVVEPVVESPTISNTLPVSVSRRNVSFRMLGL